jgi:exodeoxyribonuclease X
MRYWIVDSETTGTEDDAKVVEVAGFLCEDGELITHYKTLVNPGIPIPPTASAIHHITDDEVRDAPPIEEAILPFFDHDFEFVIAHNANFDKKYLDFGTCRWLCTWKLAMRSIPNAPSYSNQALRYHLGLAAPVFAEKEFAHRALYDSEVTMNLFHYIRGLATHEDPWDAMHKVSENPILLSKVTFGKHFGQLWKDVPREYLNFILNKSSGWDENVLHTARHYFQR